MSELLPVYLVHWSAPDWCAAAAASILGSRGVDLRLFVVDNGGAEPRALAAALPPGVEILPSGANRGFTGGANVGIADWLRRFPEALFAVIGAHDLHVEPDALAQLVAAARAHPDYGILGPSITAPRPFSGGIWDGRRHRALPLEPQTPLARRDWVSGHCMLLRRECVEEIGGFDERLGSYVEDVELCLRAGDAGWAVGVVGPAVAWGLGSRSPAAGALAEANLVLLHLLRGGRRAGWTAWGRLLVRTLRSAASRVAPVIPRPGGGSLRSGAIGLARALAGLCGIHGSRRAGGGR